MRRSISLLSAARRSRVLVAFVLALGVAFGSLLARATPCFAAITLADAPRFIGEELEEWEDTSGAASAAEALAHGDFRRLSEMWPNHGFTRSAFFYRFSLKNSTTVRRAYVLDAARAWVSEVDLYRVSEGLTVLEGRAGSLIPRAERDVPSEEPAFAIELEPDETRTYLLRLAGPAPILLRGEVSPRGAFLAAHARAALLWGGLYGVLLGVALYTAIVFAVLRNSQWWLAPALVGAALTEASNRGHLAHALPFTVPYLELRGGAIGVALVVISFAEWSRVVLRSRRSPRVDRVIRMGEVVGCALTLIASLILPWFAASLAAAIVTSTALVLAGILRWRDGHAPTRPFIIASAMVLLPASCAAAMVLGYVPTHPLVEYGDPLGGIVMSALLALGVSQEMRAAGVSLERKNREVEQKNREVTALADDLREQLVQRSRELTRALEVHGTVAKALEKDSVFDARYRVVRPLGEGGMGAVYEVVRTRDERSFALKVLRSTVDPAALARLTREAEIGARIRHPNLVSIVDVGLQDGHTPFLVMDLVRGGSLESHRARFRDVGWALDVLRGVAAGLRALHGAGVIHRDLKPSNVLMDGGVARICDFGIAKQWDAEGKLSLPRGRVTSTGAVVGTPLYMAPEALARATLSPAADVFAFGLIAFELLTGEFPLALFLSASLDSGTAVPAPILTPDVDLPIPVRALLEACVAMEPGARPTASELDAVLGRAASTPAA